MYINTGSNGQIIIDAVLTEKGRQLLRQGNFNIAKFACSDDGIDYSLSQSDILQLRILEAPINQNQSMKYKLYTNVTDISISTNDNTSTSNQ